MLLVLVEKKTESRKVFLIGTLVLHCLQTNNSALRNI